MEQVLEFVGKVLGRVFGTQNERMLRLYWRTVVDEVVPLEGKMTALADADFRRLTAQFKERLREGAAPEDLLPEAFAAGREAARRTIKMRHFDVQLIGGIVLHEGKIAEMATGEGKTLVATLPAYLNALTGRGVHIVTVNDYLARRDCQWNGPTYDLLGVSVASIQHEQSYLFDRTYLPDPNERLRFLRPCTRQEAYRADITYGTNNEFGFDYLRDNLKVRKEDQVQRGHAYAIVDEVDSILIDEARTPLIISGPAEESTEKYYVADRVAKRLVRGEELTVGKDRQKVHTGDFVVKEKEHVAFLTEQGIEKAEREVGVGSFYTGENMDWPHYLETALKAHHLYQRDRDYVVKDGEVIIVDEFTGRMMPGRRWSDGLHQAVESKEGMKIQEETQTYATITLQHYFKMYDKLAGMTGTAATEATEFEKIYNLEVCVIPTNRPMVRTNFPDVVYGTEEEKFDAVEEEIARVHATGRPILIGTTSVAKSEILAERLKLRGLKHEVLNAKHHEKEAYIVSRAGQRGALTVATNMAGRGTDIILGEGVADIGGLHILGSERHESRRIDNQLRGRCARQGDPGSSQFFMCLEDDLFRKFAPPWMKGMLQKMGLREGERIESKLVTRAITKAQKNVENHNFDIRKNLVEYDQVRTQQRKVVYGMRQRILDGSDVRQQILDMIRNRVADAAERFWPRGGEPDRPGFSEWFESRFGTRPDLDSVRERDEFEQRAVEQAERLYAGRARDLGISEVRDRVEKLGRRHLSEKGTPAPEAAMFCHMVQNEFGVAVEPLEIVRRGGPDAVTYAVDKIVSAKSAVVEEVGGRILAGAERYVLLSKIDEKWKDLLYNMDQLRDVIGLRSYAQTDPKLEYKRDATSLFNSMMEALEEDVTSLLFKMQQVAVDEERLARRWKSAQMIKEDVQAFAGGQEGAAAGDGDEKPKPIVVGPKTGRNEPCPCGSGKKYKRCHGAAVGGGMSAN
ncbi:MAG: preprotein translocase subunit SecA [Planctomycetes bacterium]|nr:preprotein translocase subunit SecA [Planctomycetota bacterium]